jgi:hypothetical protein
MPVPLKIGIHQPPFNSIDPSFPSPDIMSRQASPVDIARSSDTLSVKHVAGDGLFVVNSPAVWSNDPGYTSDLFADIVSIKDIGSTNGGVSRGTFSFKYATVLGSNKLFYLAANNGVDVTCDVGSPMTRTTASGSFGNSSLSPIPGPYIKVGRDTGYPTGLLTGQEMRTFYTPSAATPRGTWTVRAKGTGTIIIRTDAALTTTIKFVNGVCTTPTFNWPGTNYGWIITVSASDPTLPLHDVRIICPGTHPTTGQTYVAMYDANDNDPSYFLYHPDYINFHKPFACIRTADNNVNRAGAGPMQVEWADRTSRLQRFGYIGPRSCPIEDEVQLANESMSDLWHGITHRIGDDYIAKLAAYLRDNLDPRLKVYIEWALESWNSVYPTKYYGAIRWGMELDALTSLTLSGTTATAVSAAFRIATSVTASTNVATVNLNNHGFQVGAKIVVSNAGQSAYNGTFTIATVPNANSFTYPITGLPVTPATNQVVISGHGLLPGDQVVIANATVLGWNGKFTVATAPTATTFTFNAPSGLASPAVPYDAEHRLVEDQRDRSRQPPVHPRPPLDPDGGDRGLLGLLHRHRPRTGQLRLLHPQRLRRRPGQRAVASDQCRGQPDQHRAGPAVHPPGAY